MLDADQIEAFRALDEGPPAPAAPVAPVAEARKATIPAGSSPPRPR